MVILDQCNLHKPNSLSIHRENRFRNAWATLQEVVEMGRKVKRSKKLDNKKVRKKH
jgi:hypothetical protein